MNIPAKFHHPSLKNVTTRVATDRRTDGQTHRRTDGHRQATAISPLDPTVSSGLKNEFTKIISIAVRFLQTFDSKCHLTFKRLQINFKKFIIIMKSKNLRQK